MDRKYSLSADEAAAGRVGGIPGHPGASRWAVRGPVDGATAPGKGNAMGDGIEWTKGLEGDPQGDGGLGRKGVVGRRRKNALYTVEEKRRQEREAIFHRDGYVCQGCFRKVGPGTDAPAVTGKDIEGDRMRITLCIPCETEHRRKVIALSKAKKVGLSRDTWELLFKVSQARGWTLDRTIREGLEGLQGHANRPFDPSAEGLIRAKIVEAKALEAQIRVGFEATLKTLDPPGVIDYEPPSVTKTSDSTTI